MDTDNALITFSVSGSELSIGSSTGVLTFNIAPDYEIKTSYTATVTATDGTNSVTQNIAVSITNVVNDEAPVFTSGATFSAAENQTSIGTVTATDIDSDNSSITFSVSGLELSIGSSSGVLTFNSAPDYETKSSYSATVTASDGVNSTNQNITVNITDVNDNAPTITSSSTFSAEENQTSIGTVTATDADEDTLSYSLSGTDASSMSINSSSGVLTFNSEPDYETKTSYTATVTVTDSTNSVTQNITVNIVNLNDNSPLITSSATFSTPENQTSIGTVTVTDADADSISFTVTSNAPAATGSNTNNAFPQDNDSSLDETDYYVARPNPGDGVLLVVDDIDDEMVITFRNSAGVIQSSLLVTRTSSPRYYDVKSYISADGSTIELTLRNNSRGYTFGWELQIGGVSVHSNSCGQFNVRGCANDSYSSGIVYQATIFFGRP